MGYKGKGEASAMGVSVFSGGLLRSTVAATNTESVHLSSSFAVMLIYGVNYSHSRGGGGTEVRPQQTN